MAKTDDICTAKEHVQDGISLALFCCLTELLEATPSREASLVRTKLEEAQMWLDAVSEDNPTTESE